MILPILYQDAHLVVVNKPSGLLVHRTLLDRHAQEFALQVVRDQIGQHVFPVHRLDRGTSGALVFALSSFTAKLLSEEFAQMRVQKSYLAVVRGTPPAQQWIDYPLSEELDAKADRLGRTDKPAQSAQTEIHTLATCELPIQVDKYPTSRYALVRAHPKTGRKHQIRRHLRHLGHPIIGDVTHGSGKHNRFFESHFKIRRLLLACTAISFAHPHTQRQVEILAPLPADVAHLLQQLGWSDYA